MTIARSAHAVVFEGPRSLTRRRVALVSRGPGEVLVRTLYSGISTGTERLFYSGEMPDFPGMGYPLVPGYETVGEVLEAEPHSGLSAGDRVFVPGANCYSDVRGLFGGASSLVYTAAHRVIRVDASLGEDAVLFALAATAYHAIRPSAQAPLPELIVGHGALGRLLARITVALGGAPRVWETRPERRDPGAGYTVCDPADDESRCFATIVDASGHGAALERWVTHLAPRGELVLAGFYTSALNFDFVPAFLREMRLRVAAQWLPQDLEAVRHLVATGSLSLAGIVNRREPIQAADDAYRNAFEDPACLKMVLDWSNVQ
ncbi:MAG: chlorophyll synthesis pathway protein BchC [Betaproteobacteria bacterium]|nr:chlorophyll synthesis pathway protein BchC [Betaproteobacteria bacterium]